MNRRTVARAVSLAVHCGVGGTADAPIPMAPTFTHQGQLKRAGVPVNESVDLDSSLWNDLGGNDVP